MTDIEDLAASLNDDQKLALLGDPNADMPSMVSMSFMPPALAFFRPVSLDPPQMAWTSKGLAVREFLQRAEAEQIASKLSKTQKAYLADKAELRNPYRDGEKRWMSFPPPNTHRVLQRLGLIDRCGLISEKGLIVRTYLQKKKT